MGRLLPLPGKLCAVGHNGVLTGDRQCHQLATRGATATGRQVAPAGLALADLVLADLVLADLVLAALALAALALECALPPPAWRAESSRHASRPGPATSSRARSGPEAEVRLRCAAVDRGRLLIGEVGTSSRGEVLLKVRHARLKLQLAGLGGEVPS
jgi:hypothetical protein